MNNQGGVSCLESPSLYNSNSKTFMSVNNENTENI